MPGEKGLHQGLRFSQTITVTAGLTVPELSPVFQGLSDMPPVFATAYMLGFVEWTCLEAVRPYLDAGERTVGTGVTLSHSTATPVGMKVTAEVELTKVEGRMLEFSFMCRDEAETIGSGTHQRAIINLERFMGRMARKV